MSDLVDIGVGIEVGVAATKMFHGQLLAFNLLAIAFAEPLSVSRLVAQL